MRVLCLSFLVLLNLNDLSSQCNYFDTCDQVLDAFIISTSDTLDISYNCFEGCLEGAQPEENLPGNPCVFLDAPTIWLEFHTDLLATQMLIKVETAGAWTPVWAAYEGNCSDLQQVQTPQNSYGCSNEDFNPNLHRIPVEPNTTYFIALAADGDIDIPDFELCIATIIETTSCTGTIYDDCQSDSRFEIVDRSCGTDLAGPFYPGEELVVCFDYSFDSSGNGADWFHGIIPSFGNAYDLTSIENVKLNNIDWGTWFSEDDCAPILQVDMPALCTYTDENGNLKLCNGICQSCPCELGMKAGDPLPGGWFWLTNGGNAGCENDCSPGEGWGAGSTTISINFCMDLSISNDLTESACSDPYALQISIQPFNDSQTGCWIDPVNECFVDQVLLSPLWEIDCDFNTPDFIVELESCNNLPLCPNLEYSFNTNQTGVDEYSWLIENSTIESSDTVTTENNELNYSFDTTGTYKVCILINEDCRFNQCVNFEVADSYLIDFGSDILCEGISYTPDSITVNGEVYSWNGEIIVPMYSSSDTTEQYNQLFTDSCGCQFTQSFNIEILPDAEFPIMLLVDQEDLPFEYLGTIIDSVGEYTITFEGQAVNGCDSLVYLTVDFNSGINQQDENESILVFPNPVGSSLYIQNESSVFLELRIYNIDSKLLRRERFSQKIDVSDLTAGVYLLMLIDEDGNQIAKRFSKL